MADDSSQHPSPTASPNGPRSVTVVGAGLAGSQSVTELRRSGFTGQVTLLGAEGVEPYDRPPLSKELLSRTEPAWLRDELGVDLVEADVRRDSPATGLELTADGVRVHLAGSVVVADAAVLATGARAVRVPGWDSALTLHTAADAATLRAALVPGARLVVVGAGWIGAEVAGVAARHGVHVTVVEAASAPLAAALGPAVGALTVPWYEAAGVRLVVGVGVVAVHPDAVELADGEVVPADVVLAAVGARPASAWLAPTLPLTPDGSVEVDEHYRVLADGRARTDLVAVGDLARRRSRRHGWVPGGHWDGALRGPAVAVQSLLTGRDIPDQRLDVNPAHANLDAFSADAHPSDARPADAPPADPAPYVFSTQLGHELTLHGMPGARDDVVLRQGDVGFTALWFTPGTDELTAVLAADRPRDVAAARKLFTGTSLPRLDRATAADAARPLRDALR